MVVFKMNDGTLSLIVNSLETFYDKFLLGIFNDPLTIISNEETILGDVIIYLVIFLEYLEEMFPRCYMNSDVVSRL